MVDEARGTDNGNDIASVFFHTFKKAEPIIILGSISLAIGALVGSEVKYLTIFYHSIISSFMFIFSFGSYIVYELYKKHFYPSKAVEPEEYSTSIFNYNMIRFAPIYFAVIGIIFLFIIAYDFTIELNKIQTESNKVQPVPQISKYHLPIFPLTWLFFISYFLGYVIYTVIGYLDLPI